MNELQQGMQALITYTCWQTISRDAIIISLIAATLEASHEVQAHAPDVAPMQRRIFAFVNV